MFEAFPSTYRETKDGDVEPSYQPGNGNEPKYPNYLPEAMPHDVYEGYPPEERELSEGEIIDPNGPLPLEFGAPQDPEGKNVYRRGIAEARRALEDPPQDEE